MSFLDIFLPNFSNTAYGILLIIVAVVVFALYVLAQKYFPMLNFATKYIMLIAIGFFIYALIVIFGFSIIDNILNNKLYTIGALAIGLILFVWFILFKGAKKK